MKQLSLRERYPILIDFLKEHGYAHSYIRKFETEIRVILHLVETYSNFVRQNVLETFSSDFKSVILHYKIVEERRGIGGGTVAVSSWNTISFLGRCKSLG